MPDTADSSPVQDVQMFESSNWHLALTLIERRQLIRRYKPHWHDVRLQAGSETAAPPLREAELSFESNACLTERLAALSMCEAEYKTLLSLPAEALAAAVQERPQWLAQLSEVFSDESGIKCGLQQSNFLRAIEPLLKKSRRRLQEGIVVIVDGRGTKTFDPYTAEPLLVENLRRRLLWMIGRTFALELNVARVKGNLQGTTPELRFQEFIERLSDPDIAMAILEEYPVLARQLIMCADQWLAYSLEFLDRLVKDFSAICVAFAPGSDPGVLMQLKSEAGDRHRDGRSVVIAKFNSGFSIVYKPRSLATDIHFNELLAWSNQRGFDPCYRTLRVLDRGTYGWVEFVKPEPCLSTDEISRFFQRQGGNLALLFVLDATDIHHENLIAAGEHPVLVDLEALFSPQLALSETNKIELLAIDGLLNSVLRIGLLPQGAVESADFSGFGNVQGQLSPIGVPQWQQSATDEMRYVRARTVMIGGANQATLAGKPADPLKQAEAIDEGFRNMYRLLMKHRQELLSGEGPLAAFREDEVRVVLRSTLTYGHLREESFHPDVLRNAVDRDCLLDQLWVSVAREPFLSKVITAEQVALQRCDIPLFTTRANSRHLETCSGQFIPEFLSHSGLDSCMRRTHDLSEDHLERQRWLIRASLATMDANTEFQQAPSRPLGPTDNVAAEYLPAAVSAGERLLALALRGGGGAAWIGLVSTGKQRCLLVPTNIDLYDGLIGTALFLAYLGSVTRQERFASVAREALTTSLALCVPENPVMSRIGGFSGMGGLIYVLTHLGVLWNETELLAKATVTAGTLTELIDQDDQFDIIGGAAGCVLALLGLYRATGNENILDLARRGGESLLAHASEQQVGYGWCNASFGPLALTGFSHGAAGVAYALSELSAHTRTQRFDDMAMQAMLYERSVFSAEVGNWPDLRQFTQPTHNSRGEMEAFSVAWCHGAPGIGLGRLNMFERFDDLAIRAEIEAAVRTTLARGLGENQSLCHGTLGNLEFLSQAAAKLEAPDLVSCVNHHKMALLENIANHGWNCGLPLGVVSPGLMTGLAGIGYGLLRFAEPLRVPSVLSLAPPLM